MEVVVKGKYAIGKNLVDVHKKELDFLIRLDNIHLQSNVWGFRPYIGIIQRTKTACIKGFPS